MLARRGVPNPPSRPARRSSGSFGLGGVPKSDHVSSVGVETASRCGQAWRIMREKSAFGARP
jgi:hypothetical protein